MVAFVVRGEEADVISRVERRAGGFEQRNVAVGRELQRRIAFAKKRLQMRRHSDMQIAAMLRAKCIDHRHPRDRVAERRRCETHEHRLAGRIEPMPEHEPVAVEHLQQRAHEVFAPARHRLAGSHCFVEYDVMRVEIEHPHAPSVDGHLHAAAVIEVVADAFGPMQNRRAGPRKARFGEAALATWCAGADGFAHGVSGSVGAGTVCRPYVEDRNRRIAKMLPTP
jgi:hypothetical protein